MNPCTQCGATPQATDKYCNVCGTPVSAPVRAPAGAVAQDPMPAASDPFAAPQGQPAYGHQPEPPHAAPPAHGGAPPGYGAPPAGFGAPPPGYGAPPAGFGAPPPGYGAPPPGYGAPPPGYGAPPPGYGAPPAGFGGPPPGFGRPGPAYGAPPPGMGAGPQGYAAPAAVMPQSPAFPNAPAYPSAPAAPPPFASPHAGPAPSGPPQGEEPTAPAAAPQQSLAPNALRGFLVSYQSSSQGDFWPLHGGRKTIGRANSGETPDIPLADPTISSRHAVLLIDGMTGTITVEDTGSTNGTYVNEEHIGHNGRRELRDGDKVRFGGYTAYVKVMGNV